MLDLYNQGGGFMHPILFCLIVGIGASIYKFIVMMQSATNVGTLMEAIKSAYNSGGAKAGADACAGFKGPVARVLQEGLIRVDRGIDVVERAVTSAGQIEMAFLEKGMVLLSWVISLAPMLGFTGTVQGMVEAFQTIKEANDISPSIVAGGISIALLTTLFGLIVAMIVQTTQNFFISQINKLVVQMEEGTVQLIDFLIEKQDK